MGIISYFSILKSWQKTDSPVCPGASLSKGLNMSGKVLCRTYIYTLIYSIVFKSLIKAEREKLLFNSLVLNK